MEISDEIRKQILDEEKEKKRAYYREWYEKNREHRKRYMRIYRFRKKMTGNTQGGKQQ